MLFLIKYKTHCMDHVTLVGSPKKKKKTLVGWMCARHDPHTCNTDGGWCVFCVYSTAKESEILLFTQQQHMHNCTYAWFYSLKALLCTYPWVAWQRELMCGVFCPWGKCGWGQSDLGSKEACVWTVMYPPRSHLSHTWSDHKERIKCSGAARLGEHTVDIHTHGQKEACAADLSYLHGASGFMKK